MRWGVSRVAVVDIDVHFGNGTYEILKNDPRSFFASVHMIHGYDNDGFSETQIKSCCPMPHNKKKSNTRFQEGFYPSMLGCCEINDNIVSVGVYPQGFRSSGNSDELCGPIGFRTALEKHIIPKMEKFDPELLIISGDLNSYSIVCFTICY